MPSDDEHRWPYPTCVSGHATALPRESTVAELQERMASGELTARALAAAYLARIDELDPAGPALRSVIEIAPDALAVAEALDAERRERGPRGPLHGIPVLVKDNIDTADAMKTTAGSLALVDAKPERDAFVVRRLREAGAVLLGKTNLSEWANFRSTRSTSGWSARGGQCRNPYALDRNPCGSSSGSAVAVSADLCPVAVGTETDGSIVCPASSNGVVGIKPTLGLVSRAGIAPIAHSQDTAGPLARTVADAAALLQALAGPDPRDPATAGAPALDLVGALDGGDLDGLRIGVARNLAGFHDRVDAVLEDVLGSLSQLGAAVVDPADVPHATELEDHELEVLLFEFKTDLETYLTSLGGEAPRTLAELIDFNEEHRDEEMPLFGQELFVKANDKGPLTDPAYEDALATCRRLSRAEGIDAVMDEHRLDAIVAPSGGPAWITDPVNGDHYVGGNTTPAAVAGYPTVSVPAGFAFGLPVGVSFIGRAWSEQILIRAAHAFERATRHRRAPAFAPHAVP